jgi:hypothetical protein
VSLGVQERARRIGTFRFVEVRLMEIVAAWTPTTPELEVKVVFGRHIWDFAQHADALGRRMFELRQPAQRSLEPARAYVDLLDEMAAIEETAARLAALYDLILPGLQQQYEAYAGAVDAMLDAPSLVIVERILADGRRQRADADGLRHELDLPFAGADHLRARVGGTEMLSAAGA